jgi:DeoR family transcriptional regulator, fructose operon transcriptional repressor
MRQKSILDLLQDDQLVTVEALSTQLCVSEATIRRDLVSLEREGVINRTWGGATPLTSVGFEPFVHERSTYFQEEKQAIARAAVDLIEEGEVIALDVGSTCMELAKLLDRFKRITVFTNSMLTAQILAGFNFSVHLVGGRLRPGEFSMVGPIARETTGRFNYDKFFMGVSGLHLEQGPTDFNLDDVEVKQSFLKQAKRRIALLDHSKFGQVSLASICSVSELTDVITDKDVDSSHVTNLERQGIQVTLG